MTEYLIAFNDEWVPEYTDEEFRRIGTATKALVAAMEAAGVLIFTGGLDDAAPVFSVDAASGTPLFTDGPFIESRSMTERGLLLPVRTTGKVGCLRTRPRREATGSDGIAVCQQFVGIDRLLAEQELTLALAT